jgi:hypothetical protein
LTDAYYGTGTAITLAVSWNKSLYANTVQEIAFVYYGFQQFLVQNTFLSDEYLASYIQKCI